jgi:hypothetical protein
MYWGALWLSGRAARKISVQKRSPQPYEIRYK